MARQKYINDITISAYNDQRKGEVFTAQLQADAAARSAYYQQKNINQIEHNRASEAAQAELREKVNKTMFESQTNLAKAVKAQGSILASGQQAGQSMLLQLADVERQMGFKNAQLNASIFDATKIQSGDFKTDWDGDWIAKTKKYKDYWTSEFFLPWNMTLMNQSSQDKRKINYTALRYRSENQSWVSSAGTMAMRSNYFQNLTPLEINNYTKSKDSETSQDAYEQLPASHESLQDYLMWQIELSTMSKDDQFIAYNIIDYINDDGLLTESIEDLFILLKMFII